MGCLSAVCPYRRFSVWLKVHVIALRDKFNWEAVVQRLLSLAWSRDHRSPSSRSPLVYREVLGSIIVGAKHCSRCTLDASFRLNDDILCWKTAYICVRCGHRLEKNNAPLSIRVTYPFCATTE